MSPRLGFAAPLLLSLCLLLAPRARADVTADFLAAVSSGDTVQAGALLLQGADVNARDAQGAPALILAARRGDLAMTQLLLDHNANVGAADKDGAAPIAAAADAGSASVARLLLEYRADVNARTRDGGTPLMLAARSGDLSTVRELLFHGAAVNAADAAGDTALMVAARFASVPVVQALLDAGAKVDLRDDGGRSALLEAAAAGSAAKAWFLLAHGADSHAVDKTGRDALSLAEASANPDTVALFSDGPEPESPPRAAAAKPAAKPAVAISTAGAPVEFGAGPEPEAEQALREAYIRFFESDPADPISMETAETLRVSGAPVVPRMLPGSRFASTDGRDISLNLQWLFLLYKTGSGPYQRGHDLADYRKSLMNTWLQSPVQLDDFVARTASLIVHEAGHIRYGRDLGGSSKNDYFQDLQCRYRSVLFLRHRVRSDPGYLGLRDYDALIRQRLREPPSARPWWSDPLPEGMDEPIALRLDQELRRDFPGRFDYSLQWAWYRMRLLNNGLAPFRAHMLQEVHGAYDNAPFTVSADEIAQLRKEVADTERWLREHPKASKEDQEDPWVRLVTQHALGVYRTMLELDEPFAPSVAYEAYFALENTRLEGMLAQELYSYKPGPAWTSSALGPPSKDPPPLALKSLLAAPRGAIGSWKELRGNVVLLEFWATWCGPCQETIPHINDLVQAMRGKPVRFLSVTDEPKATVQAFMKKHPMKAWVATDASQSLLSDYGVSMIPTAFLVDARGKLVRQMDPREVTPAMLRRVLKGQEVNLADADAGITVPPGDDKEP